MPPDTTQEEYYKNFEGVVAGFVQQSNCDAAILAYGATGSGKTFTTQGPDLARRPAAEQSQNCSHMSLTAGIIQRAIQQILQVRPFSLDLPGIT